MHHPSAELVRSSLCRVVGAVMVAGVLALLPGVAHAEPAKTATPQLSIAIDDKADSAAKGDKLAYTITITNLGTERVKDLAVSQTVPAGSRFDSADRSGRHIGNAVSWTVNIKAAEKVTLHTSLTVAATPATLLRLATVVCAQLSAKGPPLVCASDSDELPAGALAAAAADASQDVSSTALWTSRKVVVPAAIAVVAMGGASLLLVARRRRTRH